MTVICVSQAVGLPFSWDPGVTEVISGEKNLKEKCERKKNYEEQVSLESKGKRKGLEKYE